MPYNIFISYSSKDQNQVTKVCDTIASDDISVFVADYSVHYGQSIPKKIEKAINKCDLFVVLWSINAKTSDWVQQEIGMAKIKQKPILPLVLNEGLELPAFIYELKFLPIYTSPYKAYQWLQSHVFEKAQEKKIGENILGISLAATILYLFSKSDASL